MGEKSEEIIPSTWSGMNQGRLRKGEGAPYRYSRFAHSLICRTLHVMVHVRAHHESSC